MDTAMHNLHDMGMGRLGHTLQIDLLRPGITYMAHDDQDGTWKHAREDCACGCMGAGRLP